jgi:hypothetical protein
MPGGKGPKLPNTAFNKYGSNLMEGGDIFSMLTEILQPAKALTEPPGEMVDFDSDHPLSLLRWFHSKYPRKMEVNLSKADRLSGRRINYRMMIASSPTFPPL